jgi:hypothetical protein
VARDRDVEQERKDMQRKLLDQQVHLKQQIVEEERKQAKQVMLRNACKFAFSCYRRAERSMLETRRRVFSYVVRVLHFSQPCCIFA